MSIRVLFAGCLCIGCPCFSPHFFECYGFALLACKLRGHRDRMGFKSLFFLCRGQAEKEFKVEVEAIGRVRHKNLVRLLGYCAEGAHRYLDFLL